MKFNLKQMKILTKKTKLKREFNSGTLPTNNLNSSIGGDTPSNSENALSTLDVITLITENIPPLNYGNVYYISAASGDNATAEKGNPQKPYATFAAVAALYQDGEMIYIIDGSINANGVTTLNNNFAINIYLSPNTTLQNLNITPTVNSYNHYIYGDGIITGFVYLPTQALNGNVTINCSTFNGLDGNIRVKGGIFTLNCSLYIARDTIRIGDDIDLNTVKKGIIINAKKIYSPSEGNRPVETLEYLNNSFVELNCDVFEIIGGLTGDGGDQFGGFYLNRITSHSVIYNIKTLVADNLKWLYFIQLYENPVTNLNVSLNIGYYSGPASLFQGWGPGELSVGQGTGCSVKVHADYYRCTRNDASSLFRNGTLYDQSTANYVTEISGFFISDYVPILKLTGTAQGKYKFTGTFKTLAAVPAFSLTSIAAGARLNLENAKFIVEPAQKVIEATGASNVYCINVVTNSTTTDAEVTEVGQAIVRNANFL